MKKLFLILSATFMLTAILTTPAKYADAAEIETHLVSYYDQQGCTYVVDFLFINLIGDKNDAHQFGMGYWESYWESSWGCTNY